MICTSIQHKTYAEILEKLENPVVEMAEIRLDRCKLSDEEIEALFAATDTPLIATCRASESKDQARLLKLAAEAGARYVDLEIEAPVQTSKLMRDVCSEQGVELIRSYHNFTETPSAEFLQQVLARCWRYGADVAKIVTTAASDADVDTVMTLYTDVSAGKLIAFAMGENARTSRIEALRKGAPFCYAAVTEDDCTAPGQYSAARMHAEVFGKDRKFFRSGLRMPASKSFAQRAIVAAALSEGTSRLGGYTPCDDSEAAIAAARALGASVTRSGRTLTVKGIGPVTKPLGLKTLNAGESGLLARLMVPLLSQINGSEVTITGEKTLLRRPLKGVSDIMASFGVLIKEQKVPLTVTGQLIPGVADISGKNGSQLISGLLMALPLADKNSMLYVSEPKSIPYMFVTLDVLRHFGIRTSSEMEGDEEMISDDDWAACSKVTFKIKGQQAYKAANFNIESDWSAAANLLVAGAVFGSVEIEGLDSKSLQADLSIIDILVDAGAAVSQSEEGAIRVRKGPLRAVDVDLGNAPDLFPIVSVLAAFCAGRSRISGIGRLAGKESDRAAGILEMLTSMGVSAAIDGDDLFVEGESLASRTLGGRLLKGGQYSSRHDHRMAMALKVASIGAESPVIIDDEACVCKSFPDFFSLFD